MLLKTVKPEDVDPSFAPDDYAAYKTRQAVRAIVFDGGKVALIHVSTHNYYMLPGGGIDDGEDPVTALQRELQEELGVRAAIGNAVGAVEVYFDRWKQRQTDQCFTAYVGERAAGVRPTSFERAEGHEVVWFDSVEAALRLVQSALPANRDGKLIQARDSQFLQALLANRAYCYLFALEIVPLETGHAYEELPLHCTLMHRFWTRLSPDELVAQTRDIFSAAQPLILNVTERAALGPKQLPVALVDHTPDIERLNTALYDRLNHLGVEYTAPQWVGPGHVFHVTDKPNAELGIGESLTCRAVYLIEVNVPGHDHARIPRTKIMLGQTG